MSSEPTSRQLSLYCDGELSAEEARRIEAQLTESPQLQAQVQLERRLKQRVAAVLQGEGDAAPADLARRIRDCIAADPAAVLERRGGRPAAHRPWWRAPQRANVFAIGATLSLVAGAVLVGIFGPSIDSWGGRGVVDAIADAAAAVAGEHANSTTDFAAAQRRWSYRTADEAVQQLGPLLGAVSRILDLSDLGYQFAGGNTCNVPHCEHGCHLFYRHRGDRHGMVSLHVVADGPNIDLRASPDLHLPIPTELIPESAACSRNVLLWTHGPRCYLLVVCIPEDALPIAKRMQEAMRAAEGRVP